MECPRCHYANAGGARFCGECGASLTRDVTCSSCGHANPAGQTFCNGCGGRLDESARSAARDRRAYTPKHLVEKILASRTALEGERKQVTVLFADLKGSMDLAEQIDPEMFHQVMERVAALLAEGVHRFEGTVTQFTGDGLMALFGAPIAHEDHAQRACFAALHLSEELRRYAEGSSPRGASACRTGDPGGRSGRGRRLPRPDGGDRLGRPGQRVDPVARGDPWTGSRSRSPSASWPPISCDRTAGFMRPARSMGAVASRPRSPITSCPGAAAAPISTRISSASVRHITARGTCSADGRGGGATAIGCSGTPAARCSARWACRRQGDGWMRASASCARWARVDGGAENLMPDGPQAPEPPPGNRDRRAEANRLARLVLEGELRPELFHTPRADGGPHAT